jgi:uncharacterized protein
MSSGPFPERVDAARLFARNGRITADLPLQRLPRLTASLADSEGQASVALQFGLDVEGRKLLTGTVDAILHLSCQRCLQRMDWPVSSELAMLVFDTREQLDKVLRLQGSDDLAHDVLVLDELDDGSGVAADEQELNVQALIEDELILSLPLVPLHEDASCSQEWNSLRARSEAEEAQAAPKPNPFAVLAQLKGKSGKEGDKK